MNKIYSIGNVFFLLLDGAVEPLQDSKALVNVWPLDTAAGLFRIESPKIGYKEILLSTMTDEAGTAYDATTWKTFYTENTGFSSAGGGSSVVGALKVIGFWNADTNTPDLNALTLEQGEAYQVSVTGSTPINGETNWRAKDLVVWSDGLAGNWFKIDNTDDVLSVNGKTGAVIIEITDIPGLQTALAGKLDAVATVGPVSGDGKVGTPVKLDWRPPEVSMASLTATAGIQVFDAPAGGNAYTTPENEGFRMDLPLTLHGVPYDGSTVDVFIEYNLFSAPGAGDQVEFNVGYMMGRAGVDNYNGPGVAGTPVNFAVGTVNANEQTRQKIGEFTGNAGDTHVQLTINRNNLPPALDYAGDFDVYALILEKQ